MIFYTYTYRGGLAGLADQFFLKFEAHKTTSVAIGNGRGFFVERDRGSILLQSRLQKVETRKLQLAGTGERLIISNSYNCHNARSPVPARKNLLFAGDSLQALFNVHRTSNVQNLTKLSNFFFL
jgi:hypothetical protein